MFPDPRLAPRDGPLAVGGTLRPDIVVAAYRSGIFPWPHAPGELYWWSPDPRAIFEVGTSLRVSRTLRRTLRRGRFRTTRDRDFAGVVRGCADRPEGTWITAEMQAAYLRLHHVGHAHSVEVHSDAGLVGGVYGITVGGVFCGESMFHREADASKVALVALDRHLQEQGFVLIDAQLPTDHLTSMGAQVISRDDYLDRLATARDLPVRW